MKAEQALGIRLNKSMSDMRGAFLGCITFFTFHDKPFALFLCEDNGGQVFHSINP
jgi:hypothetical protein